ncbi:MAG: hypothetical protein KA352_01175 [Flavobacteriales bacterium]|nr:hypothetical protein [Flavobacteriales bacterium]
MSEREEVIRSLQDIAARLDVKTQVADGAEIVRLLVRGGHTPNGAFMEIDDVVIELGLEYWRAYEAVHSLKMFGLIHTLPFNAMDRQRARIRANTGNQMKEDKFGLRLNEKGLDYAQKEVAVRYQSKQLDDFDNAVERGVTSLRISKRAYGLSILAILIAGATLGWRIWTDNRAAQKTGAPVQIAPVVETVRERIPEHVWATCGPCDTVP